GRAGRPPSPGRSRGGRPAAGRCGSGTGDRGRSPPPGTSRAPARAARRDRRAVRPPSLLLLFSLFSHPYREPGPLPLRISVDQSSGPETLPGELAHGVVGVDAIATSAIGDDVGVPGKRPHVPAQLADRHRARAPDVPRRELG